MPPLHLSTPDSVKQHMKQIYEDNKIDEGSKILLLFMFASMEEMCLFSMHPWFLAVDTTFKSNKDKKELLIFAFKDGSNKAAQAGKAYISSSGRWLFHIVFQHCFPLLYGRNVCNQVYLFITDGDQDVYIPLQQAIKVRIHLCFELLTISILF